MTSQTQDYMYRVVRNFVKVKKGKFNKISTIKERDLQFEIITWVVEDVLPEQSVSNGSFL